MRALPALIVIALVLAGVLAIAELPGRVVVVWQGWRIDTSVAVLTVSTPTLTGAESSCGVSLWWGRLTIFR